jgi:hypothetical protein
MEIVTIILSAVGAAGIAAVGYLKARAAGESFLLSKFLQTISIGAVVGVGIGVSGGQITDTAVSQQVTAIASLGMGGFVTYLVETFGKYVYRGETTANVTAVTSTLITTPDIIQTTPTTTAAQTATTEQPKTTYEVKASGQVDVGGFKVTVPYADVGLDPSKYTVGSLDWQHACINVLDAESGYSELSSATGKPTAANPLEKAAITAAAALATYQGIVGKSINNIKADAAAVNA